MTAAAPHAEVVRSAVGDRLTPEQVDQLGEICAAVRTGVDPSAGCATGDDTPCGAD